jgi:hypothetical protein
MKKTMSMETEIAMKMTILNTMCFSTKSLRVIFFMLIIVTHTFLTTSYAAHPLITDDTGTQGKGKLLFELNGQTSNDREKASDDTGTNIMTKGRESEVKAALSYGIMDNVDIILGFPYQWKKDKENDATTSEVRGIADMSLEVKWRLFDKDGFSIALKPGLTLPMGDKDKDLGTGRVTGSLYCIATKEVNALAFHLNLGYKRNDNRLDERENIWHASLAGELKVIKDLKLVANIGAERNTDKASGTNPAYILGGFVYSIRENLDTDFGIKIGLNETEKDITFLGGIALRF